MTEKWKNRLRLRGEFGNGFAVGMVLAAVPIAAFLIFGIMPRVVGLADKWGEVHVLSSENYDKMAAIADACHQREEESRSAATVLYEFQPNEGIEVLGGVFNLGPGRAIGGRDAHGHQVMRWYIPAKIKPVVYGSNQGYAYGWFNRETRQFEGPFVPEVQR